jgi:apolipoprotein D and lipocalin family protein
MMARAGKAARARWWAICLAALTLVACTGIPSGVEAVHGFDLQRYLGTWYEIARLDHSFERGLTRVTAHYNRRADGGVRVVNRGYDPESGKWREAVGRAYPVGASDVGRLKVSFFGPFYAGYNIIALDREHYRYAMVCGPNRTYLWILAREPTLAPSILKRLLDRAKALGFATDQLIFVQHRDGP